MPEATFYDEKYWLALFGSDLCPDDHFYLEVVNDWLDKLRINPRTRYLDVSCGQGHTLYIARQRGAQGYGIDFSLAALQAGKEKFGLQELIRQDAASLPFRSGIFDSISCLGALEHYQKPELALLEMQRVSQPSGLFLFVVPNAHHIFGSLLNLVDPQTIITDFGFEEWGAFFAKNGFRVIGQWPDNHTYHRPLAPFKLRRLVRKSLGPLVNCAGMKRAWQFCFLCEKALVPATPSASTSRHVPV